MVVTHFLRTTTEARDDFALHLVGVGGRGTGVVADDARASGRHSA